MTLGKNVRLLRIARGWEQKDLSAESGVAIGTISAIEVRNSKRSQFANDLARALGVTAETLADDEAVARLVDIAQGGGPHAAIDVQSRWVDDVQSLQGPASSSSEIDTESVYIPHYDTGGAMGHGIVLRDQPGVIREMRVSKEWIQKNVRGYTSAENLCLVTGFGDSMRPLFNSGDPIIVDRGITQFQGDGLYFFRADGEGFIKRLQSIPGRGLVVISENPAYEKWAIDSKTPDFQVLGKVVKAWCGGDY